MKDTSDEITGGEILLAALALLVVISLVAIFVKEVLPEIWEFLKGIVQWVI